MSLAQLGFPAFRTNPERLIVTRAFVIRPFGKKKDSSGQDIDFEYIHKLLFAPALKETTDGGGTTGEVIEAGNIREDMFALIVEADLVLCDITVHNANIFYELGIRHALRPKGTLLVKGEPSEGTPFDLLTDRYLPYDVHDPGATKDTLVHAIRTTMTSWRKTDSPVFQGSNTCY